MISNEAIGDHPRSRGVYWRVQRARYARQGSSPLARGLQDDRSDLSLGPRIIPARAGFTASLPPGRHPRTDHPRSRGVYSGMTRKTAVRRGSSPLARGLRRVRQPTSPGTGIIPARAGFTREPTPPRPRHPDHPRSRGVYIHLSVSKPHDCGSSPLARGLLIPRSMRTGAVRIIPARAGFTRGRHVRTPRRTDHPRSRGVYAPRTRVVCLSDGSSPLARGLPSEGHVLAVLRGIIPARAGFTQARLCRRRQLGDHPRSRGVYGFICPVSNRVGGSSPLARGLREPVADVERVGGIIPARAGFTTRSSRSRSPCPDHPRSRGVYRVSVVDAGEREGSSPLARGLPGGSRRRGCSARIIPARAGFTGWCG